jgi:hypothetical protein
MPPVKDLAATLAIAALVGTAALGTFLAFKGTEDRAEAVKAALTPGMTAAEALAVVARMQGDFRAWTVEPVAGWQDGDRVYVAIDGDGKGAYVVKYADAPNDGMTTLRLATSEALASFVAASAPKIRRFDRLRFTAEGALGDLTYEARFDADGKLAAVTRAEEPQVAHAATP